MLERFRGRRAGSQCGTFAKYPLIIAFFPEFSRVRARYFGP
jgi:hypothetical protein